MNNIKIINSSSTNICFQYFQQIINISFSENFSINYYSNEVIINGNKFIFNSSYDAKEGFEFILEHISKINAELMTSTF
jgi:hypothetical protein